MATTPQAAPVALHAGYLENMVGKGAWFPRGGGQMLSAAFAEVIRSHGGAIRTHAHVEKILVEGGRVTGVRLAGGEILRASVVVSDADIKRTYRDLVGYEHLPRLLARRCERWKMAPPLINAFFGIELDLTETPNSNYFAIPDWDGASSLVSLERTTRRLLRNADRRDPLDWAVDYARHQPGFVQCSTRRDPSNRRSAPPGHAAIEVQTLAPSNPRMWGLDPEQVAAGTYRKEPRYREIKEIITGGLLDRVEQVYPGARARVWWGELGSPATQERYTHTTEGNSYGLEPRISQVGPMRPGPRTPVAGLFLAGTSTVWGPAWEGAMLSGLHAAAAITGRDLQTEIREGVVLADRSRLSEWDEDFDPLAACRRLGGPARESVDEPAEEELAAPLTLGGPAR